jgi:hypothetical protein
MPARECIGLVVLKAVQGLPDHGYPGTRLQTAILQVIKGEAGTNGRNEQIAEVGKIKTKNDAEKGFFKYRELRIDDKNDAQRKRNKIVTAVCDLEDGGSGRSNELFQPNRWMDAEEEIIDPDQNVIEASMPQAWFDKTPKR